MGKQLGLREFVALMAFLFSLIALGTDSMLPALGLISTDLDVVDHNRTQLVITVFLLGTGLGQLISGPMSDAYGRKVVLGIGVVLFIVSSIWAVFTSDFTMLLVARFVQGLGISAPRAAGNAMVRDLYSGRQMARVLSLVMMVFVLAPAMAPLIGQTIMNAFGWRAIFTSMMISGLIGFLWLTFRQQETLAVEDRVPFKLGSLLNGYKIVFTNKRVIVSTLVQALALAGLFAYISTAHQLFADWLNEEARFPIFFALIALLSATSNVLNAIFVERLGMWIISTYAIASNVAVSVVTLALLFSGLVPEQFTLLVFMIWSIAMFLTVAMCIGNLTSLAMEPVGHIAGIASSIIGSTSTMLSIILAIPIGMLFNGTGLPMIACIIVMSALALALQFINPRNVVAT